MNRGFASIALIIVLVVVIAGGAGYWFLTQQQSGDSSPSVPTELPTTKQQPTRNSAKNTQTAVAIDNMSIATTSFQPIITGTASGVESVDIRILTTPGNPKATTDMGGYELARMDNVPVTGGQWKAITPKARITIPGSYNVQVIADAQHTVTGQLQVSAPAGVVCGAKGPDGYDPVMYDYENQSTLEVEGARLLSRDVGWCSPYELGTRGYITYTCQAWIDGCNICSRTRPGGPSTCGKNSCSSPQQAVCSAYFGD